MRRRDFLTQCAGSSLALSGLAACSSLQSTGRQADAPSSSISTPPRRPNILVIFMDDLGWGDLGCQGHPVLRTPSIDRLAAQGCRFTDFYVSMPICSPSRASLLTGRDPNRYGFKHVINTGMVNPHVQVPVVHHLPVDEPTLPRLLKQAGYRAGMIGKWHLSLAFSHPGEPTPADYGYDDYFINTGSKSLYQGPGRWHAPAGAIDLPENDWFAPHYVEQAIRFMNASGDQPFFLQVCPFTPHVREEAAEEFRSLYAGLSEQEKTYYGCISQFDFQVGRLLDHLDASGLSENTIVVFSSDNGPEPPVLEPNHPEARRGSTGGLRGAKHVIYEGGIRVSGIIRWPGLSHPGSVSHVPVSILDLLPTFCRAAAAPLPAEVEFDGADLRPAFEGRAVERPHPLYWQCEYAMRTFVSVNFSSPPLALREGRYKLMSNLEFDRLELFNLEFDPGEQWNLATVYPEVVQAMLPRLQAVHAQVNGPSSRSGKWLNPGIPAQPK